VLFRSGYATGATLKDALVQAWAGDPVSAYGSVIAVTRPVDLETAQVLKGRFVEILLAPSFDPDALAFLREKSKDIRLLEVGALDGAEKESFVLKHVTGGILRQTRDLVSFQEWRVVTRAQFPGAKEALAKFTWGVCKHVKSNAIVLGEEYAPGQFRVLGMGAGQPNRVDSLRKLAVTKARENLEIEAKEKGITDPERFFKERIAGSVAASEAFFPMVDAVEEANQAGIRALVQPGGSKRDSEVIAACDKFGIAMIFTRTRHFRH
jgi:phosphoribosylaminoimidazolecarboxamide formyltransferase / IMP cyclohydrolase